MQESCYGECLVHRMSNFKDMLAKVGLIALIVLSGSSMLAFFNMGFTSGVVITFVILAVSIGLSIYLFPRFNVDWEYVFVDGQLDFDQILGGNARKRKDRIDFDDTEVVAPTGSHHLDSFNNVTMKTLDYSSRSGDKTYTIICHKKDQMFRILFEPNDNMVKLMKQKSYRKVFMD